MNGFDTRLIQQSPEYRTGEVMVTLDHKGNPSFNIVKDAAYDHLRFNSHIAAVLQQEPNLIYFGTLAQRTEHGYDSIQRILSSRSPVRAVCMTLISVRIVTMKKLSGRHCDSRM